MPEKTRFAHAQRTRLAVEGLEDRLVPTYFPSTATGIHIFEDQLPSGMSSAMMQFLATHTDGTQKELLSQTQQLRAINPNFTVLHYQLGTGNSPYAYIIGNQWASDWSTVNQQESWFVHQTDSGEPQSSTDLSSGRVGNSTGWNQADISNPAWQQYTLTQVLRNMAATGSNGWFADSFDYGIGAAGYGGTVPTRYQGTNAANPADWPGGAAWTTQLGSWAQTVETAFGSYNAANGTSYKFLPNLDALVTSWEPSWYDNSSGAPFIDGAFLEDFGSWTDTYDWTLSMNRGLSFTDNGKIIIMQPYTTASPSTAAGAQQVDFYLGTYLLLKGDQTYLNIDAGGGAQYFPQYQVNLGAPTTPLPSNVSGYLWNGVYRRDFQNGFVLVNPGSTSYTLNLGGTYQEMQASGGGALSDSQISASGNYIGGSLGYTNVSSVTLAGSSAAIFLDANISPLSVKSPAAAAASTVRGTSVSLSVLGQENGSSNGLTYTWSSSGPAAVDFTVSGTTAARNTTAVFAEAGAYTLTATITDGATSVTSSVKVTVSQTLSTIKVTPSTATVPDGARQQFSAAGLDQFGLPLATQPAFTWSIARGGIGVINSRGLYSAPGHITGTATIRASRGTVTGMAGVQVVASGTAAIVKADSTDKGNWQQDYGADGYIITGAAASIPSYVGVSMAGQSPFIYSTTTTDVRALATLPGGRIASTWYAPTTFTLNLDVTDGKTHQVALYLLDWNSAGRSERITVLNSTGQVIDTRTVSSFQGGQYEVWNVAGDVTFQITCLAGPNAVLSGIFFGGLKS
jgi:hypothetical protein